VRDALNAESPSRVASIPIMDSDLRKQGLDNDDFENELRGDDNHMDDVSLNFDQDIMSSVKNFEESVQNDFKVDFDFTQQEN
jgi:hypothetical protein